MIVLFIVVISFLNCFIDESDIKRNHFLIMSAYFHLFFSFYFSVFLLKRNVYIYIYQCSYRKITIMAKKVSRGINSKIGNNFYSENHLSFLRIVFVPYTHESSAGN